VLKNSPTRRRLLQLRKQLGSSQDSANSSSQHISGHLFVQDAVDQVCSHLERDCRRTFPSQDQPYGKGTSNIEFFPIG
jgi:hypothetical protein